MGKSRLVEEFLERVALPHAFFTAIGGDRAADLAGFAVEVASSSLPHASRIKDFAAPQNWDAALSLLATVLPTDTPSIVVLDEMPYWCVKTPVSKGRSRRRSTGPCPGSPSC
ncbi:hypothetical protein GCM10023223_43900 [Stackebrandtia albiflava]